MGAPKAPKTANKKRRILSSVEKAHDEWDSRKQTMVGWALILGLWYTFPLFFKSPAWRCQRSCRLESAGYTVWVTKMSPDAFSEFHAAKLVYMFGRLYIRASHMHGSALRPTPAQVLTAACFPEVRWSSTNPLSRLRAGAGRTTNHHVGASGQRWALDDRPSSHGSS